MDPEPIKEVQAYVMHGTNQERAIREAQRTLRSAGMDILAETLGLHGGPAALCVALAAIMDASSLRCRVTNPLLARRAEKALREAIATLSRT